MPRRQAQADPCITRGRVEQQIVNQREGPVGINKLSWPVLT
jgi:hypothetical protein